MHILLGLFSDLEGFAVLRAEKSFRVGGRLVMPRTQGCAKRANPGLIDGTASRFLTSVLASSCRMRWGTSDQRIAPWTGQ
jgi:hypothetical protein